MGVVTNGFVVITPAPMGIVVSVPVCWDTTAVVSKRQETFKRRRNVFKKTQSHRLGMWFMGRIRGSLRE